MTVLKYINNIQFKNIHNSKADTSSDMNIEEKSQYKNNGQTGDIAQYNIKKQV